MAPLIAFVYAIGSLICHQIPERSFHYGAYQLPVCARCLGIYAGAAVAALLIGVSAQTGVCGQRPWGRLDADPMRRRLLMGLGAMPTLVTVAFEWLGVWETSNAVRFGAGIPLGVAVAAVLMATLHYERCARRPPIRSPRPPSPI